MELLRALKDNQVSDISHMEVILIISLSSHTSIGRGSKTRYRKVPDAAVMGSLMRSFTSAISVPKVN